MPTEFPEHDWRVFRELREVALERLCAGALQEAAAIVEDSTRSHHERFLALLDSLGDRNALVTRGFDGPRRSTMLLQLAFIHRLGLLEDRELARFSERTRERIESLARLVQAG